MRTENSKATGLCDLRFIIKLHKKLSRGGDWWWLVITLITAHYREWFPVVISCSVIRYINCIHLHNIYIVIIKGHSHIPPSVLFFPLPSPLNLWSNSKHFMRVSHWGLCSDIIANMQHALGRLESIVMGKASPIIWGLRGPLIALCNNMLQWCALLGAMNVNAPPPHHLLPSLKHNVSTMPTKGQFTGLGARLVGTHSAALKDWSNTFKCALWILLVTRDLVFISYLFVYPGQSIKDKI